MDVHYSVEVMRSMKKQSAARLLLWVVMIMLHEHLSIAAVRNSNETMSLCDGSLQDCPILHQLESQFATITARMLAEGNPLINSKVFNKNRPVVNKRVCRDYIGYRSCAPFGGSGKNPEKCNVYKRNCP